MTYSHVYSHVTYMDMSVFREILSPEIVLSSMHQRHFSSVFFSIFANPLPFLLLDHSILSLDRCSLQAPHISNLTTSNVPLRDDVMSWGFDSRCHLSVSWVAHVRLCDVVTLVWVVSHISPKFTPSGTAHGITRKSWILHLKNVTDLILE